MTLYSSLLKRILNNENEIKSKKLELREQKRPSGTKSDKKCDQDWVTRNPTVHKDYILSDSKMA